VRREIEIQHKGEQFHILNSANLPTSPSFPNRLLFAAGGLGAGLALGLGIAAWLEVRDKAIRTETDVEAVMELSMLTSLRGWENAMRIRTTRKWGRARSLTLPTKNR